MESPLFFWSNLGIALSYFLIPLGLFALVWRAWAHLTVLFRLTLLQFGFFIVACATGHTFEAFGVDHHLLDGWHLLTFLVSFSVALQMPAIADRTLYFIQEKRLIAQELTHREAQFQAFFDSPQLLAWMKDETFKIVYNNKTLVDLYGDLTGTRDSDRNPELTTEANDQQVLETGQPFEYIETVPDPNGKSHTWLSYKFPVVVEGDVYIGGLAVEVTERERLRQEAVRAAADLEQFAYAASHDLRTPLRGISGLLSILERKLQDKLTDAELPLFNQIQADCAYATELVNDILQYSRIGRSPLQLEVIHLPELLQNIYERLQPIIQENDATIHWDARLMTIYGDRTQLTQIFENLIGNALKYRSQDSPKIDISSVLTTTHLIISVQDNGIGIEPQDQERLFQMFQRLHSRSEIEGTGIGLATVRKIAQRHGGEAWVESNGSGCGSIFSFSIARYLS